LIPYLTKPFIERMQNQQQQLELDLPSGLPTLMADRSYLERVLTELLNNACKYTTAGETIRVAALAIDSEIELRVTNSGTEIPETERDRVFDKFYRIPHNDPWKHGGTGLGLALVKKLVSCLGGTIHIESSPQDTSFVLRFPQAAGNG
jgi:signal transduction histidine kinase